MRTLRSNQSAQASETSWYVLEMLPQIQVNRLCKSFVNGQGESLQVLNDLDFEAETSTFHSIIGASGAGKSTLINLLGGLDLPTSGEVLVQGQSLSTMTRKQIATFRNQNIGFVFQFHHLLQDFSALENVAMPLLIHGALRKEAFEKASRALQQVGLSHRSTHRPAQLSGGEQQRTAIARAIVNSPAILLADEPTGNLDQHNSKQIFDLLLQLNQETQMTLIVITHNLELAKQAPFQLKMSSGKLCFVSNQA